MLKLIVVQYFQIYIKAFWVCVSKSSDLNKSKVSVFDSVFLQSKFVHLIEPPQQTCMLVLASRIHVVNYYQPPISFFATVFVRRCTSEVQGKREEVEWMAPTRFRRLNAVDWHFILLLQKGTWTRKSDLLQLLILLFFLCLKPTVCFQERPENVLQYSWEAGEVTWKSWKKQCFPFNHIIWRGGAPTSSFRPKLSEAQL